jgi:hypothetical protein
MPATTTSPERFIGVAALAEPAPGSTEAVLFLQLRPRFAGTTASDKLLSAALTLAKASGARTLITSQFTAPDPREFSLRRAGFASAEEGKSWSAALA